MVDWLGAGGSDQTYRAFDANGQALALVIGDAHGCHLAGALAGVQAFVCPVDEGGRSLIVGQPSGPAATVDLSSDRYAEVALGGRGSVIAVGYDSGRLEVYRFSEGRLELLWVRELSSQVYDVFVGRGDDPLIAYFAMDGSLRVLDIQGWLAMDASSTYPPLIGDVGGFVTLFGDHIQTYRITLQPSCAAAGGR